MGIFSRNWSFSYYILELLFVLDNASLNYRFFFELMRITIFKSSAKICADVHYKFI